MKNYFENPTLVSFWEPADHCFINGIAYRDEIICGCCGGIFEIKEILYEAAEDEIKEPITVLPWYDFS